MRFCVLAVLVSATVSVAPASAALTIGSNLEGGGDTGACAFSGPGERSCTIAQQTLAAPQLTAANGLLSPRAGIVTRWRLRTGNPAPGTKEVQARLRVIDGEEGGAAPPTSSCRWPNPAFTPSPPTWRSNPTSRSASTCA